MVSYQFHIEKLVTLLLLLLLLLLLISSCAVASCLKVQYVRICKLSQAVSLLT